MTKRFGIALNKLLISLVNLEITPRSCRGSSTFLIESGNLTYSITENYMISGVLLKQRNVT